MSIFRKTPPKMGFKSYSLMYKSIFQLKYYQNFIIYKLGECEDENNWLLKLFLRFISCWYKKILVRNWPIGICLHCLIGPFFQKAWWIFLITQKMCWKLSWERDCEIAFCLESADSSCTAVSKGGKIQNTKLKIEHSTFFGQWK